MCALGAERGRAPWLAVQDRVKLTAPLLEDRKGKEERARDHGPNISFKGTLLLTELPSTWLIC